ncbi:MAG: hypothetical protein FWD46_01220 [Cystobacterineae bacterium]|nr:hypothetical protein [Cystobacterineae bacterium]
MENLVPENRLFDKRCALHYISTGALSQEAFQQHLDALPDIAEKACPIEASMGEETPAEALEPNPPVTTLAEMP